MDVSTLKVRVESSGIKEASSALGGLSTSANNAEKRVSALTIAMDRLNVQSKLSEGITNSYNTKLQAQMQTMAALRADTAASATATKALAAAMEALTASLVTVVTSNNAARNSQRGHNDSMREAHALARGLSGSLGALWVTYGNLSGMAIGLAIGVSLKQVVTQGTEVEHILEGIRVRGNETVDSINKIRESVFELGKGVYGPIQVANAFETLILAGLRADQALQSINAALNLATVGGTTIEKAASTLVSVGTAIGYTAEGYSRVGDVIAKTAALSMSSVETLSEAFKSASSVNRLYGVSLADIATSLGILSNLGIKGSAAGTALKNFYKELSAEGEKVVKTLNIIGVTPIKLKNGAGEFRPLLDVIKELDTGLNKLSEMEQKTAIARLSNERGLRLMTQALGLYREKLADGSNALQKFHDDAENSYAFAAQGAVQMALTAKSQLQSMANTLRTTFAEVFKSVEPEVVLFSQHMKAAFGSKDFKDGIATIASAFGRLALAIAENLPLLVSLATGLIAVKAAMIGQAAWAAAASGVGILGVAYTALGAGTLTLTAALGPLGIVLGVVAAAWIAYKLAKDDSQAEKSAAVAAAYSKSYIEGMTKEAERLQLTTQRMRENRTEKQANEEIDRNLAVQEAQRVDQKAVTAAKLEVIARKTELASAGYSDAKVKALSATSAKSGFDQIDKYVESLGREERANQRAANNNKLYAASLETLTKAGKEHAIEAEKQAAAARNRETTPAVVSLGAGDNGKGAADRYAAMQTKIQGEIEAEQRKLQNIQSANEALFKTGEIDRIQLIQNNASAAITAYKNEAEAYSSKVDTITGKLQRENAQEVARNKSREMDDKANQASIKAQQDINIEVARMQKENTANYVKELERKGQFIEAAGVKNITIEKEIDLQSRALARVMGEMFDAPVAGSNTLQQQLVATTEKLRGLQATAASNTLSGAFEEAKLKFQTLHNTVVAGIEKIQNKSLTGTSIFSGIASDAELAKYRRDTLPGLLEALPALEAVATATGATAEQTKFYNQQLAFVNAQQKEINKNDPYAGARDSLTKYSAEAQQDGKLIGDAMSNAFKGAEDAFTKFLTTGQVDFKTFADSIIADLARIAAKKMIAGALGGGSNENNMPGSSGGSFFENVLGRIVQSYTGYSGNADNYGSTASMGAAQSGMTAANSANYAGMGFAEGGTPPIGLPSLVGEDGPEVFVPRQAGTIIPNDQLGGGGTTTVTYAPVINIDSRSDAAQIKQMVDASVRNGNNELAERLQRAGKLRG